MRLTCPKCETDFEVDDTLARNAVNGMHCPSCGAIVREAPITLKRTESGIPPGVDGPRPIRSAPSPEVLRVLREEAARETKARREEAMTAQAALGSDSTRRDGTPKPPEPPELMARANDVSGSGAERREDSVRTGEASGIGRGATKLLPGAIVLTALAALLVYSFVPQIVKLMPQTEPLLIVYVENANELRALIKAMIDNVLRVPESNS